MPYSVFLTPSAQKDLKQLSKPVQTRILDFLENRIANLDNPKSIGKSLSGKRYKGIWCYRVGNYRLFTRIQNQQLVVSVIEIEHRSEAYRR